MNRVMSDNDAGDGVEPRDGGDAVAPSPGSMSDNDTGDGVEPRDGGDPVAPNVVQRQSATLDVVRRHPCRRDGATPSPASRLLALFTVCLFLVPGVATAQSSGESTASTSSAQRTEGEVSNIVQELSQEIESPYCPGKTLAMCPSGGAAEVRRDIQRKAEHGLSREEIKAAILEEHGEEYGLREPPAEDHYPLIGAVAVGLLICIGAVAYLSRRRDDDPDQPPSDDDDDDDDLSDDEEMYLEEVRSQYQE